MIMTLYPKLIHDALATVRYPGNGKNLVEAEMVADNLRITHWPPCVIPATGKTSSRQRWWPTTCASTA